MEELVPVGGELDGDAGHRIGRAPGHQGHHCEWDACTPVDWMNANQSSCGHIVSRL